MGLDTVELVMAIEETFGVEISDSTAATWSCPRDIIDWLTGEQTAGRLFLEEQPGVPLIAHVSGWFQPGRERQSLRLERRHHGRTEIAEHVRRLTIGHLGLRPEDYREDGRFVQDFGVD